MLRSITFAVADSEKTDSREVIHSQYLLSLAKTSLILSGTLVLFSYQRHLSIYLTQYLSAATQQKESTHVMVTFEEAMAECQYVN
jgi:hypothetical protein